MKPKQLEISPDGSVLSRMVTGVWRWESLTPQETTNLIEQSVEAGITSFDHADIYGSYTCEALFGKAFKSTNVKRDDIQLVSKCGIRLISENRPKNSFHCYDTNAAYIIKSVENSLKNLATDYLDVLLIHRPSPLMDADEIAEAFTKLEVAGKVRHFGVSNFTPSQFDLLFDRFPKLVTNQVEISPLMLETYLDGTLEQCQKYRISPMAWSPLGGGALFQKDGTEQTKRVQAVLKNLQEKYDAQLDQIVFAWLLHHSVNIIPILGTTKASRFAQAVSALEIELTNEEWFQVWVASTGEEVP